MVKRITGKVSEIEYFDKDLLRARFRLDEPVEFEAGQFMSIAVDGYVRRSYSILNAPHNNTFLETLVDCSPGGPGSKYFLSLKEGDEADILAPLGNFIYKKSHLPVMFFATGTGLVPFLSMIQHELERVNSDREMTLFYGVRRESRVVVGDLLDEWAAVNDNFNYHLFVSRPESVDENPHVGADNTSAEGQWREGRLTQAIPEIDFSGIEVYICGGGEMINEVERMVLAQNGEGDRIYYERFY